MRLITKKDERRWVEVRWCRFQVLPPSNKRTMQALERNTKKVFDKKLRQRVDEPDKIGFTQDFYRGIIVGWDPEWGEKITDEDGKLVPFSDEALMTLLDLNAELAGEIIEAAEDLGSVIEEEKVEQVKNSKSGDGTGAKPKH
jgi:hypothetical protein